MKTHVTPRNQRPPRRRGNPIKRRNDVNVMLPSFETNRGASASFISRSNLSRPLLQSSINAWWGLSSSGMMIRRKLLSLLQHVAIWKDVLVARKDLLFRSSRSRTDFRMWMLFIFEVWWPDGDAGYLHAWKRNEVLWYCMRALTYGKPMPSRALTCISRPSPAIYALLKKRIETSPQRSRLLTQLKENLLLYSSAQSVLFLLLTILSFHCNMWVVGNR